MPRDIRFDCKLERRDDALRIRYEIENKESTLLGVFNRIRAIRADGGVDFSPNLSYIELDGEVLHIQKRALPVPSHLNVSAYIPPNASRIEPGATLVETFEVDIPVLVCQPFRRALVRGEVVADKPATATEIVVSIGVFPCGAGCSLVAEHPAFPGVMTAQPPGPAVQDQIVLSERFKLTSPLDVLDYRGAPWK